MHTGDLFSCVAPSSDKLFARGHRFIKILKKPKAIVQGFFFRGPKICVEKSNPSESKRKEKLNGTCFSCIAHVSREL